MREKDDKFDRSQKEYEFQLSKLTRNSETERENLKREYDGLIATMEKEYESTVASLKADLDQKSKQVDIMSFEKKDLDEQHKKERN